MLFAHDLGRPAHTRDARAWTEPTDDGFVRVVAEFDVDAEAWRSSSASWQRPA